MRSDFAKLCAVTAITTFFANAALAGTLDDIKSRGSIRVGVKADSVPSGFLDSSGNLKGAEIDLAAALAKRLDVKFEPVIVTSANRIEFLQQRKVDVLVATVAASPERGRVVDLIKPPYAVAGTNIAALKSKRFSAWTDLKGRILCGQQGSTFNKWVEQTYGAKTVSFPTIDDAFAALRAGNCEAFVYNDKVLSFGTSGASWADYEIPLPSEFPQFHSMVVRKGDGESDLGKFLSDTIISWAQSGELNAFYSKWNTSADDPKLGASNQEYKAALVRK